MEIQLSASQGKRHPSPADLHTDHFSPAPVCARDHGENFSRPSAPPHHGSPGSIAEQDAAIAILPVKKSKDELDPDHKDRAARGAHARASDVQALEESRAPHAPLIEGWIMSRL